MPLWNQIQFTVLRASIEETKLILDHLLLDSTLLLRVPSGLQTAVHLLHTGVVLSGRECCRRFSGPSVTYSQLLIPDSQSALSPHKCYEHCELPIYSFVLVGVSFVS